MSTFDHRDFCNHEFVAFKDDPVSGLRAIIAVHNSNLGPALGGCRMYSYSSSDAALSDVLRLSRGMTYKSAIAGIRLGGGKSVIIGDPKKIKTRELLLAMGDFVESLGGKYITAEDSGTGVADISIMSERTQHVSGVIEGEKYGGDPSPVTAYGVYQGILASVNYQYKSDLKGIRVGIQGVGHVGFHLAKMLKNAGAIVYGADISSANIDRAVAELSIEKLAQDKILAADVDVLAPCALGGAISAQSLPDIKAKIVAGSANNQLASVDMGEQLMDRGILYAPDYVINAGGIIDVYYQRQGIREHDRVNAHVERIGQTLSRIFELSKSNNRSTSAIADQLAEDIFMADSNKPIAA